MIERKKEEEKKELGAFRQRKNEREWNESSSP